ncbi:GNAT family N-acetyltransferase [Hydrotalea sandarakina]|jgi:putative acetyltransferase|uniref:Putative acetyltransferase n=1 Tax=Hydrotalea sandarakina TaxID=1004304 RepID=A0A2W7S3S2_9BACT|nr:GNAT family N-acetyltransferase [Hydrotalea sandarakina]PZX61947.1 putative acetyltransferase [Hydrotalea sandarakina]
MQQTIEIVKYSEKYRVQLLDVWEKSVLETHHFLSATDFHEIKEIVTAIDFSAFDVYCLLERNNVIGFLGIANQKIEMLFLSPEQIGKGLGKKLLNFAIHYLNANKVDVNEQNTNAVKFYSKFGFKTYERTAKDEQGKNYPLLRMELKK